MSATKPVGVLRRTALTLSLTVTPATVASGQSQDDLTAVLGGALYPVQLMAYCWREVEDDSAFLEAGRGWNGRNWQLLANIEALGREAGVSEAERRRIDETTLAAIAETVSGQGDRAAYCRTLAGLVEQGFFDIDQREDLRAALKRIFGID